ncbi:invasion associated secreted endopeptidase [Listeria weihenstephanensis FSL R9-0317]|uniref:Probable endopeptidase p60 n=1 Tax=Listeria weihenstephanensis TaxID=1006155 RepID=A0A1S7FS35_9LIST|nr:LysM peptidoglycan-binding domain-containing protein [Listeria weihenstephanensis]AQY50223.1 peptidase [Listeria weihenstephanensis]EUJ40530.1 invasion associated secreted endopeptidase [Listeria weihenstephanensis FSL R9-0317]
MKKAAIATATAGIAVTAFAAPTIASANTVIVQAGDTLWGIAQKAGTDVDTIKKANKLTSDTIFPGQKLEVSKEAEAVTKSVNATWLNVRQGPSADNTILTSIKGGTQVTVESTEANGWNKVTLADGKTGFVNGKYLSDASAPVVETAPSAPVAQEEVTEQKTETEVAPKAEAEVAKPAAEQEVAADATTHKVKSGDTLWALSTKYGVSVQNLIAWNNLSSSSIYVGQTLAVNQSEAQAPAAVEKEVTAPVVKEEAAETVTETAPTQEKEALQEEVKEETPAPVAPPKVEQNEAPVVQVDTNASTYTVQSGDSLSKIATLFSTSVANLQAINSLDNDTIVVGDVLKVKGSAPVKETVNKPDTEKPTTPTVSKPDTNTSTNVNKPSKPVVNTSNTSSYTVQSGDSYYTIAQKFGTTVSNLKALNNASSDSLQVGDVLKVKGTASTSNNNSNVSKPSNNNNSSSNNNSNSGNDSSSSATASFSSLMNEAQKHLGKPYSWGGNGPSTFDCSGYTKYVFAKAGISIPRTSGSQYAASTKISASQAQPGDLVFFDYGSGIAHVGIYIGGGQMIDAQDNGVKIDNISSGYWAKYLVGYGRVANF